VTWGGGNAWATATSVPGPGVQLLYGRRSGRNGRAQGLNNNKEQVKEGRMRKSIDSRCRDHIYKENQLFELNSRSVSCKEKRGRGKGGAQ